MARRRAVVGVIGLMLVAALGAVPWAATPGWAQLTPPGIPAAPGPVAEPPSTPPRLSYLVGPVSFWRPGAVDWAPAQINLPLAPGDLLYAAPGGTLEVQLGPLAFVRGGEGTQLGVDNQDATILQLRVPAGHVALDLRELAPGLGIELDTPAATFLVRDPGYYRLDVDAGAATFSALRGGRASVSMPDGGATWVPADRQLVVAATEPPVLAAAPAPPLTAWDRWNLDRTDVLARAASAGYLSPGVYGAEALDRYGRWESVAPYGPVWVPQDVPVGWVPYSTGRWLWDPRFGWTWLDDAPWGWAPYHYGRWMLVDAGWAWIPGPRVVEPAYAPALVVFLGAPEVPAARPVCWAPLGWGEPVVPWWGGPGFAGVPRWVGWGGPHVVNTVLVDPRARVRAGDLRIYRHVHVSDAVVGVPAAQFGRGRVHAAHIPRQQARALAPAHGAVGIRPVPASVVPAPGPAVKPPAGIQTRPVVATRPPKDWTPELRAHGLAVIPSDRPTRLVGRPGRSGADVSASTPPASPAVPAPGPGGGTRSDAARPAVSPPPPRGDATPGSRGRARVDEPVAHRGPRDATEALLGSAGGPRDEPAGRRAHPDGTIGSPGAAGGPADPAMRRKAPPVTPPSTPPAGAPPAPSTTAPGNEAARRPARPVPPPSNPPSIAQPGTVARGQWPRVSREVAAMPGRGAAAFPPGTSPPGVARPPASPRPGGPATDATHREPHPAEPSAASASAPVSRPAPPRIAAAPGKPETARPVAPPARAPAAEPVVVRGDRGIPRAAGMPAGRPAPPARLPSDS
jgi:hypothetical protein